MEKQLKKSVIDEIYRRSTNIESCVFFDHISLPSAPSLKEVSPIFLDMYNMGHGDCFLIHDGNNQEGLLIDCGSQPQATLYVTNARTQLDKDIHSIKNLSFLLSHPHQDHFNQLQSINKTLFNDVFLANVVSSADIHVLLLGLKLFSKKSIIFRKAYNYLSFIPRVFKHLNNSSCIHFVSAGYNLKNSLGSYDVLWPQLPISISGKSKKIDEIFIKCASNKLFASVVDAFMELLLSAQEERKEKLLILSGINEPAKLAALAINALEKFMADKSGFLNNLSQKDKKEIESLVKKTANSTSIVFYETNRKILFTGDITKGNYKSHVSQHIPSKIHILKTPHHGSKTHFHVCYPHADIALISEIGLGIHIDWTNYSAPNYSYRIACAPGILPAPTNTTFFKCRIRFPI